MHPPIFPVTQKLLREVSTASARTDGTRTYTLKKSILLLRTLRRGLYICVTREREKIKGKCGEWNKHFVKCQVWARWM